MPLRSGGPDEAHDLPQSTEHHALCRDARSLFFTAPARKAGHDFAFQLLEIIAGNGFAARNRNDVAVFHRQNTAMDRAVAMAIIGSLPMDDGRHEHGQQIRMLRQDAEPAR